MPLSDLPLVSILTPSFNQGRYLPACLESARGQDYQNLEHVVCDGGSTDSTLPILRHQPSDGRLRWSSEADHGQADALLKAFARSRGQIIGWLNSDDAYVSPRVVEHAVATFHTAPDVGVVYGHGILTSASGRVMYVARAGSCMDPATLLRCPFLQPTVFIRRAVLERFGFVDPRFHYLLDKELWLRLARAGVVFRRLDEFIAIDRYHASRKTHTVTEQWLHERRVITQQPPPITRALWRISRIAIRIHGAALVHRLYQAPLFPFIQLPARGKVYISQVAVPRRFVRAYELPHAPAELAPAASIDHDPEPPARQA